MAQQTVGLGTEADDGTGDNARVAGEKINNNFTELYAAVEDNVSGDGTILKVVKLTQAEYDVLDPVVATTLYVIVG